MKYEIRKNLVYLNTLKQIIGEVKVSKNINQSDLEYLLDIIADKLISGLNM